MKDVRFREVRETDYDYYIWENASTGTVWLIRMRDNQSTGHSFTTSHKAFSWCEARGLNVDPHVYSRKTPKRLTEAASPIATLISATDARYALASREVDGLLVRDRVPNLDSIDGYFAESETLAGVRVVPMADLGGPRSVFYAADDFARSERLAEAIRESGEINPLIIGVDKEGPFIIEGAHRYVALYYLKAKEFPAVVVVGRD